MEKEKVKLDYPMAIGDKKRGDYARNGILFTHKGPKGYTQIESPFELGIGDFATLSQEDLYKLESHTQGTAYQDVVGMASRVQQLRLQAQTVHLDGFPYPTTEKPFTWELHTEIPKELKEQLRTLESFGVIDVKVGLEMEFSCPEIAISGFEKWNVVKQSEIARLTSQLSNLEDEESKLALQSKITQIAEFNAREVMMYELIELNPNTKGMLEPLFGLSRDGDGYYDARGVLELKTKPTDPVTSIKNRLIALRELYDTATSYGLEITLPPSFHVNVSMWTKDGNIFDDANPAFSINAKIVTEGITKAFYDAVFVILNKYDIPSDKLIKLALDVNRQNLLRYSTDRIEIRPSVHSNLQDPDIMLSVFLAGAIYGFKNKGKGLDVKATKVESPVAHHTKDIAKVTSHLINNSTIGEGGILQVSEEYIHEHLDTIEYELGITDTPPDGTMGSFITRLFGLSENAPFVKEFLSNIRVKKTDDNKLELEFPETSKGKYLYTLPAVNLEKIPLKLQMKLAFGKELSYEELHDYLLPGDTIPRLAKNVVIDVERIKNDIKIQGTKSKYIVKEYDLNKVRMLKKPKNWTNVAWSRYNRLLKSKPILNGMSPDFRVRFTKLAKEFATPEKKVVNRISFNQARAMFLEKMLDRDFVVEKMPNYLIDSYTRQGMVERKDFLPKYVKVSIAGVVNPDTVEKSIKSLFVALSPVGDDLVCIVDNHAYSDGTYSVDIEFEPRALNKVIGYAKDIK